jgi:hypothetical protein
MDRNCTNEFLWVGEGETSLLLFLEFGERWLKFLDRNRGRLCAFLKCRLLVDAEGRQEWCFPSSTELTCRQCDRDFEDKYADTNRGTCSLGHKITGACASLKVASRRLQVLASRGGRKSEEDTQAKEQAGAISVASRTGNTTDCSRTTVCVRIVIVV